MRMKWAFTLVFAFVLLQGAAAARAQEVSQSPGGIDELKEQIAKLARVEGDASVPAEVRNLNRGFLEERRARLRALLQNKLEALRSYRAAVGSALTPDETRQVDDSILGIEKDLRELQPGATRPAAAEASTAGVAPSVAPPVVTGGGVAVARASGARTASALFAPAAPRQDLVPVGSDPDPSDDNVIRKAIREQIVSLSGEVGRAAPAANQTLAQARMEAMDITANPLLYSLLLTNRMLPRDEFVRDIEAARIDKQTGGTGGNAGSTTLVSKGGTPAVLGFAVENGGLTRSVDGTTVTFRGNPVGLVEAFQKTGFIPSYRDSQSASLLRKLSFSVSFDTSRGDTPGTFLANRQQLSSYSLRYEFKNDRDPRNPKYKKDWERLVSGHAQSMVNGIARIQRFLDTHPAYVAWRTAAQEAVAAASPGDLPDVLARQFEAFQAIEIPAELAALVESFQTDFTAYRQERGKLLDLVAKAPIFTLEYVNDRRPGLIDTSTLNFIAETGMFEGRADLTFNGTVTFFNADPGAGMKRVRNFDNSLRLDVPLGDMRRFGAFLTFAGKYQRMMEDEKTSGGAAMATKGDIATGQLLLTIPVGKTGFKIPISMSFANRTEFIKEKEVKGNFGFTFDLDSVLQRLKPF
jgi:hypothetical protein